MRACRPVTAGLLSGLLAALALVALAVGARAQSRIAVVGMLLPASLNPNTTRITGELARGLRDLG